MQNSLIKMTNLIKQTLVVLFMVGLIVLIISQCWPYTFNNNHNHSPAIKKATTGHDSVTETLTPKQLNIYNGAFNTCQNNAFPNTTSNRALCEYFADGCAMNNIG